MNFSVYGLLLACTLAITLIDSAEIDNRLVGEPIVDCQDTQVSLTFNTEKPFSGRIYVKGLSDDNRCARNFATNSDQSQFSMLIAQGDCDMKRQRVFGPGEPIEGLVFSLVIVVSFHGTFVTKADRAFRCMCFFRNIKRVTNFIDMSMIGTTELRDTVEMPTCTYEVRSGSPTGGIVRYAKIGDKIFHVWKCDDPAQGFLVHSCWVNDGRGNRFDLLDIDGCAIDPIIQPDVSYSEDLSMAMVETHGYKFSDTSVLDYMCVIELCKIAQGECNGLVPPACGKGRKRRSVDTVLVKAQKALDVDLGSPAELDLNANMQILDTIDDEMGGTGGPSNDLLRSLNNRSYRNVRVFRGDPGSEELCMSSHTFGIILALTLVLFLTACVTTAFLCLRGKRAF